MAEVVQSLTIVLVALATIAQGKRITLLRHRLDGDR